MVSAKRRIGAIGMVLALAGTSLAATSAHAQPVAPQSKVSPNAAAGVQAADTNAPPGTAVPAAPVNSAMTDMLRRLDSLETQLTRLTAQTEEDANKISQLDARIKVLEQDRAARLAAEAKAKAEAKAQAEAAAAQQAAQQPVAVQKEAENPAPPSPERLAAVKKIVKPKTKDPGDDEYIYGYRLWSAGFFPEAEQQLGMFVGKYPDHWRTTYGMNLLGRAYLDDGKPKEAASWFLKNYQDDKTGARAPDSLLYLAETMIALKDTKRACIALTEFGETYRPVATGRLKDQYEADRGKVTCN